MGKDYSITVSPADRRRLEQIVANGNTAQKHVKRARIVLASAEGQLNGAIARRVGVSLPTVHRWLERYRNAGVDGLLQDCSRPPGTPALSAAKVAEVIERTQQEPPGDITYWTRRAMAAATGISARSVGRIWQASGFQPHRVRTFKLSRDRQFVEKVRDVIGLYVDPPDHALVFLVDEKSQIQALERTQRGLPMRAGQLATHDYRRHGTTTLFAALNVLDGTVIGQCSNRHRHQEFIAFLNKLNRATPRCLAVHLSADNYATHKHPKVKRWLARHPRFHLHFTPTSASWLNAVESFFSALTRKRLKRASFRGIVELQAAIHRFIAQPNEKAERFVWVAEVDDILRKVNKANGLSATP